MKVKWIADEPRDSQLFFDCWTSFGEERDPVKSLTPTGVQLKSAMCAYFVTRTEALDAAASASDLGDLVAKDDAELRTQLREPVLRGPYHWQRARSLVQVIRRSPFPSPIIGMPDLVVRAFDVGSHTVDAVDTATVQMVVVRRASLDPLSLDSPVRTTRVRATLSALIADDEVLDRLVYPELIDEGVMFCDHEDARFAWSPGELGSPSSIQVGIFRGQLYFLRLKAPYGYPKDGTVRFRQVPLDEYIADVGPEG